jgi:heme/copper-type cytochrome/quinol oxidase subunit 3
VSETNQSMALGHAANMEPSPYAIPSRKLAMWLFILSDACTFGALLFALGRSLHRKPATSAKLCAGWA